MSFAYSLQLPLKRRLALEGNEHFAYVKCVSSEAVEEQMFAVLGSLGSGKRLET